MARPPPQAVAYSPVESVLHLAVGGSRMVARLRCYRMVLSDNLAAGQLTVGLRPPPAWPLIPAFRMCAANVPLDQAAPF